MANKPMKTINFGGEDTYYLAPDFKNIENAPFGEETTYGDTLTWDGNTEGLVSDSNGIFFKVSDIILTIDDVQNGCTVKMQSFDGSTDEISMTGEELALVDGVLMMPNAFSVHSEAVGVDLDGMVFSETGTYLSYIPENSYVSSLTVNGYNGFEMKVVKPIDNKYLEPFETVGGDTLTWDGNTEGLEVNDFGSGGAMLFYKVSSATPALEDFANGGKLDFFDDGVAEITQDMLTSNNGAIFDTEMTFVIAHENEMGLSKGVWFNGAIAPIALTINGYTGFTTTKLKEEYIPVDYIKQLIAEVTGN